MLKLLKNKTFISLTLILAISSLGIFFADTRVAQANWLVDVGFESIAWILLRVGAIAQSFASLFLTLAAMLLEIAFGLEKFTKAGVVQIGWKLTRDLVNMGFILILLVIAFATILRIQRYGAKDILWKLIAAALLINFSLVIAGAIIDFAQIVTHFFYDEIRGNAGIGTQIAKIMQLSKVYQINGNANLPEKIAGGVGGLIMAGFSIVLGTILILLAAFALAAGALFMLVRLVRLWILLIMAPIEWFSWILPNTQQRFDKWWTNFLTWTFFAPVYMFFIWLAVKAGEQGAFASMINSEIDSIVQASGFFSTIGVFLVATPSFFLQFIVIVIILFMGIYYAKDLGAVGAKGAIDLAQNFGKRQAAVWGKKPAEWTTNKLDKAATKLKESKIGRYTGASWAVGQAARGTRQLTEKIKTSIEDDKKKYRSWTDDNKKAEFKSADSQTKVALAELLAENGALAPKPESGFTEEDIKDVIKLARKYGKQDVMLKNRPDLADDVRTAVGKADPEKIQKEAYTAKVQNEIIFHLSDPSGAWRKDKLNKVIEKNPALAPEFTQLLRDNWAGLRDDIKKHLSADVTKSLFGEIAPPEAKPKEEKPAGFTS